MAWSRMVSGSTAGNVSLNIDVNVTSCTRTSNTNVRVTYGVRFQMATSTYTYNSIAAFCPAGGTRYYAFNHSSGHTNAGTWYYANTSGATTTSETAPFVLDIPVTITQTSASFEIGYGWDAYQPSQKGKSTVTVGFPTGATAPTGCWCSVNSYTETSVTISGGYSSNGNATVTSSGYQYRKSGTDTWTNCGSTINGLSPNTKYYFRYYATNSQGTTYSDSTGGTTTHDYPYITSTPNFTIGGAFKLTFYNPLGRTLVVNGLAKSDGRRIFNGTCNSTTLGPGFNDPNSVNYQYQSIPNAQEGSYKVQLICSEIGRDTTIDGGKYYIRGDEIPTFESSNITDVVDTLLVDTITGNNTKIIKGHNKITGKITKMTGNYYASGSRYVVSASATPASQELSYDNGATKTFTFENITVNSFSVTAYDTRGLPNAKTKTIDLVEYSAPKINNLTLTRQNGLGTYAILTADGTFTHWSGWNQIKKYNTIQKVWYRYKPATSNNWSTNWLDITNGLTKNENGSWTVAITLDTVFETTLKYDFQLYVQDLLENSQPISNTLSTANGFLWRDLKNKRLGINKKPDEVLDVNGNIKTNSSYILASGNTIPDYTIEQEW